MALLELVNSLIAQRTQYGMRKQFVPRRGYVLIWSNNGACWYITRSFDVKVNSTLELDANQIYVPFWQGEKKSDLESILPQLNQLPLYGNSWEVCHGGAKVK